jgi:hypothetical protein
VLSRISDLLQMAAFFLGMGRGLGVRSAAPSWKKAFESCHGV